MKICVLMGSPRKQGNTASLTEEFLKECTALGLATQMVHLYEQNINPCLGCMGCQECLDSWGCVQRDGLEDVCSAMQKADILVFATPIYAWYCTSPMKALLERAVYAGNKNYGSKKGPALLEGKRVVSIVTCGYPAQKGADLWEEGLRRMCRHSKMEYMGMFCRRDYGGGTPFLTEEAVVGIRDFARAIDLAVKVDGV